MHDETHQDISRAELREYKNIRSSIKAVKRLSVCFRACEWRSGSESLSVKGALVPHRSFSESPTF